MNAQLIQLSQEIGREFQLMQGSPLEGIDVSDSVKLRTHAEQMLSQVADFQQEFICQYGENYLTGIPVPPLKQEVIRAAEQYLSDRRNVNFVLKPPSGFLAIKPKENDIRYFAACIRLLRQYYTTLLEETPSRKGSPVQAKMAKYQSTADLCVQNSRMRDTFDGENIQSDDIYVGNILLPLEPAAAKVLKRGRWFDGQQLRLPFTYCVSEPFTLFVEYVAKEEKTARQWSGQLLRSLIYQVTRTLKPYDYQFFFFDPRGGNSGLEAFAKLKDIQNGNAFQLHEKLFPQNRFSMLKSGATSEQENELLRELDDSIGQINDIRAGYPNIHAYNASVEQQSAQNEADVTGLIPQKFVFFDNIHGNTGGKAFEVLQKALRNAKKCGISVVITSCRNVEETLKPDDSDWKLEQRLRDTCDEIITRYETHGQIQIAATSMGEQPEPEQNIPKRYMFLYEPASAASGSDNKESASAYVNSLTEAFRPKLNFVSDYFERIDLDQIWGKSYAQDRITVPLGVNARGQIATLGFGDSVAAHVLLCGRTGCGKSTLLHAIINGVIAHYRPEDVQLWLSDYKSNEFMRYIEKTPPHIKYVATDTSHEYSLRFLDKIWNEMCRRQKLFGSISSIADYRAVHGKDSMPRLLILVDECHVLSDHIRMEPEYKEKFERLLREMRAYGMIFFLSDQTGETGLKGFSSEALKQIACRLSMQQKIEDYNALFDIKNAAEIDDINKLQEHEVTIRRVSVTTRLDGSKDVRYYYEKSKVLYLKREDIEAIVERSIASYGPCTGFQYVLRPKREQANWPELLAEGQQQENPDTQLLYLGTPTGMEKIAYIPLVDSLGENIMCIGSDIAMQASILEQLVESIRHAEKSYEIQVLADAHSSLEKKCDSWLRSQLATDPHLHLYKKEEMLSAAIFDLWEEYHRRCRELDEPDKEIYLIWLGMDDIGQNMTFYHNESPDPANGEMNYNAMPHIQELLNGPKRGMHNIVFYQSAQSLNMVPGVKADFFRHKIAFAMGQDDASQFLGSYRRLLDADEKLIDKETAVYYNGMHTVQFKPYIGMVEQGTAIDPALLQQAEKLEKQQLQQFRKRKEAWLQGGEESDQIPEPQKREFRKKETAALNGLDGLFGVEAPQEEIDRLRKQFELAFRSGDETIEEKPLAEEQQPVEGQPPTEPLKLWYVWDGTAGRQLTVCNGFSLCYGWDSTAGVWVKLTTQMYLFDPSTNSWQAMPLDGDGQIDLR